jgi:arylsulfatase
MAAAGVPDITTRLLAGHQAGDKTFKVHLDGYNLLPYLTGQQPQSPRTWFAYFNDDAQLVNLRVGDWKFVYLEQRAHQFEVWREPFVKLRIPKLFNLRRDPFERADSDSNNYHHWTIENSYVFFEATPVAEQLLQSFVAFPPRQKPTAFNLDEVMRQMKEHPSSGK